MNAKRVCVALAWMVMTLVITSRSQADLMLDLTTTSDLSALNVGDVVTFNVELSGLPGGSPAGDADFLAATVVFDSVLLGTPTLPVAGGIVPDLAYFAPNPGPPPGQVDAFYDTFFAFPPLGPVIVSDGVFFSFDVTALAPGTGTIGFDPAGTAGLDSLLNDIINPADLPARLPYTILASGTAIPEPSSLLLMGALAASCLGWSRWRKRQASNC